MLLLGQVLKVETRSGVSNGEAYSYTEVHVLEGVTVHAARLAREFPPGDIPRPGETIAAVVDLFPFKRKNGAAGLSVTLLRPADAADLDAVLAASSASSS